MGAMISFEGKASQEGAGVRSVHTRAFHKEDGS
jgi:hypothetical protein